MSDIAVLPSGYLKARVEGALAQYFTFETTAGFVNTDTAASSDTYEINIVPYGGQTWDTSRGAGIRVYGADHASEAGNLLLSSGDANLDKITFDAAGIGGGIDMTFLGANPLGFSHASSTHTLSTSSAFTIDATGQILLTTDASGDFRSFYTSGSAGARMFLDGASNRVWLGGAGSPLSDPAGNASQLFIGASGEYARLSHPTTILLDAATPGANRLQISNGQFKTQTTGDWDHQVSGVERFRIFASGAMVSTLNTDDNGHIINAPARPKLIFQSSTYGGSTEIFIDGGGFGTGSAGSMAVRANSLNGVHLPVAGTAWATHSDKRNKKNIIDLPYGLETVLNIKPKAFDYKSDEIDESARLGWLAQDVREFIPEAVDGDDTTRLSLCESHLVPVLWNAIRELAELTLAPNDLQSQKGRRPARKLAAVSFRERRLAQIERLKKDKVLQTKS